MKGVCLLSTVHYLIYPHHNHDTPHHQSLSACPQISLTHLPVPMQDMRRSSAQENAVGDLVIVPQVLSQHLEAARLEKLQQKVKDIIGDADQDGDGKIRSVAVLRIK